MFALARSRHLPALIVLGFVGSTALACGSSNKGFDEGSQPANPQSGNLPNDNGGGGNSGDLNNQNDNNNGGDPNQCAADVTAAKRAEVDIIVVIDTSGSMGEEMAQVQQNINNFATSIGNSGLDYQVIMLAEKQGPAIPLPIPIPIPPTGICTPAPLGGANCADNPPKYHHINQTVDSTNSLDLILSTYDTQWKSMLRQSAYKVFIEVTDDNSDLDWQQFDTQLLAKQPAGMFGTASARKYIFNSIVGWQDNTAPLSSQKCGSAVNNGDQYQHLSQTTSGIIDSVCKTSYANVFNNIAKGLVTTLGCEFAIPVPKNGGTVDPTKVVVNYTPGGQTTPSPLQQVTDASKCGSIPNAWYYDDNNNPKKILFCKSLCDTAGADTGGKLEIALGCKAAPPK